MNEMMQEINRLIRADNAEFTLFGKLLFALIVFLLARILLKLAVRWIDQSKVIGRTIKTGKHQTIVRLLSNALKAVILFVAGIIILNIFGLNTNSLIATAGIGGIAIGFGAQALVKDVLTGVFLMLEEQYAVGDLVTASGVTGTVEDVGLRLTKLRDFNGALHIIPNGSISVVTNQSNGGQRAMVEILLPYTVPYHDAREWLTQACQKVTEEFEEISRVPEVLGITKMSEYTYTVSILGYALKGTQWKMEREIRNKVLEELYRHSVSMPQPIFVKEQVTDDEV